MLKRKNLIYSLIGLNIILLTALIFYKLPPTVEAQPTCVPITGGGMYTLWGATNKDHIDRSCYVTNPRTGACSCGALSDASLGRFLNPNQPNCVDNLSNCATEVHFCY